MVEVQRDVGTALSVLLQRGLPDGGTTLVGSIDGVERFDESTGQLVPLAGGWAPADSTLCVFGWAADVGASGPAAGVCVRFGDTLFDAQYGESRDDVSVQLGGAAFLHTGFRSFVTLDRAHRGAFAPSALVVSADARSMTTLSGAPTITIVEGEPPLTLGSPRVPGSASVHVDGWRLDAQPERPSSSLLRAPRGTLIGLRGWIRDRIADGPVAAVFAVVDEHDIVRGNAWQPRPDVAAEFGRDDLLPTGFSVRIDTGALAPGPHTVRIGMVTANGAAHDVDEQRFPFVVVPNHR